MGTDIHLYIERQDAKGVWHRAACSAWPCPWCAGNGAYPDGRCCYSCEGRKVTKEPYHERNYNVFAMLANVRNGVGFAGCDTGDGFAPLAEPRGLPDDTAIHDTENLEYGDDGYVWLGDHSFSYCTLAEALTYDYERTTKHRGYVTAQEYIAWRALAEKSPRSYSGDVWGPAVKKVSVEALERLIAVGAPLGDTYALVEWQDTYRESAGENWFAFLDACKSIDPDPTKVRFVYGFDS
jgi:hypothetical protein